MESRSDELYHVLCEKGYPDDFCREIAYRQMNTDYTATSTGSLIPARRT